MIRREYMCILFFFCMFIFNTGCDGVSINKVGLDIGKDNAKDAAQSVFDPDISLGKIKDSIKLGKPLNEIINIYGDQYIVGTDHLEEKIVRYDFVGERDYKFYSPSPESDIASVDIEGLKSGKMLYQLYLHVQENNVFIYSIAYKNSDGLVHVFYEFLDGTTKEDIVE